MYAQNNYPPMQLHCKPGQIFSSYAGKSRKIKISKTLSKIHLVDAMQGKNELNNVKEHLCAKQLSAHATTL
jgi:hypothetical protein